VRRYDGAAGEASAPADEPLLEPLAGAPPPLHTAIRWQGWAALALALVAWEAFVRLANIPVLYLPGPSTVIVALYELFAQGGLWRDLLATLGRIFGGFIIAAATGVALGIWMGTSRHAEAIGDVFIAALYPLPKVTLIPLFIIWLGSGETFQLTLSWLGAIFPIVVNTLLGVKECDKGLMLAARDLGASERQIKWRVILPSAVPHIFAGLRLGLGVSIILVVAAEMVTGRTGLGARLYLAGQVLETGQVFAILLLLAILGIAVSKGQDAIDRLLGNWRSG
jgi:NitT/TauT family transport system permease protein